MEQNKELKDEIIYYFNEMGILMYGEFMLGEEDDISLKYYEFLNNPVITSSIKTKINHLVCYLFYKTKSNPELCKNKINNILSKLNDNLAINHYNFILICNLIHYYNEYFDIDENEVLFLLKKLQKFTKLIINNKIHDEDDNLTLVILFYYYYSILLINLFKNKKYISYKYINIENFFKYIELKFNELKTGYIDDNIYREKYDNNYFSLNLNDLNNYAERKNKKLLYFISYVKLFLSISNNKKDDRIKNFDFFFYEDNKLNKEIKMDMLSRKILYQILNYDEDKIKDFKFYDILIKNNPNNNIINNKEINNSIKINNIPIINENNNNNIIGEENNIISKVNNLVEINNNSSPEEQNNSNDCNSIDSINILNNNNYNIILCKKKYFSIILKTNKYLLFNELKLIDNDNIKLDMNLINSIKLLHVPNTYNNNLYDIYHKYNIDILETKMSIKIMPQNCFFNIISKHNEIMIHSNKVINQNIGERKEIYNLCSEFYKYLINENDDNKNFIKNSNYLKALIMRVFYNYMELLFIDIKLNINNNDKYENKYKEFENVIEEFEIDNYLIFKIKADYHFITKNLEESIKYYKLYNSSTKYKSPSGLFGEAVSTYIIGNIKRNDEARNIISTCTDILNKKYMKIGNYISFINCIEKIKSSFE